MNEKNRPMCYKCVHRRTVPGDAHSRCNNHEAHVVGNLMGVRRGWFRWPANFDPTWLEECDGFSAKQEEVRDDTR